MDLSGWSKFEERLIYDRYSIREPKIGKRLEKTFEDIIDRISDYLLSKEFPVDKKIIKTALSWARKRKLTFATPALMNLGNPYVNRKGYYSCFTLGPIPDNTKEILDFHNTCATIFQYAGGSGMDFSQLRASDSPVDGGQGVSSGPCSFIKLFEKVSEVIAAGGKRRGAELGQLDCNHPDIFDFVNFKQNNPDLTAINISVNVLSEFWDNEKLIKEIAKGMWTTGDPGLLFPDEMSSNSPYPPKWKPLARYVNPCVVGDTRVSTNIGHIPIIDLASKFKENNKSFKVLNKNGNYTYPTMCEKTREDVEIWRVDFNNGSYLEGDKDHSLPIITDDKLKEINNLPYFSRKDLLSRLIKKQFKDINLCDNVVSELMVLNPSSIQTHKVTQSYSTGRRQDVFNITEPETHQVVYNNILSFNCGEHVAPPFSVCNLLTGSAIGSINNEESIEDTKYFELLGYYMTYLGNCILWLAINNEGEGLPKESVHFQRMFDTISDIRPVGVGLTGIAEYLHHHNINYNNTDKIFEIYAALTRGSLVASNEWYKAAGEEAKWDEDYKKSHLKKINYNSQDTKFWNTITTCQAPTGSVSQFLRCISTGIEPLTSSTIIRSFYGPDNLFHDVKLSSSILGSEVKLDPVSALDQLKVVSTVQNIMHTSASKTIIVPKETTVEEIKDIIYKSKEYKLKGLTVYRMGCSLDSIVRSEEEDKLSNKIKTKLPDVRKGFTFKFRGMNSLYITVNLLNDTPIEIFMASGKSGNVVNGLCMGLGRLASLALRSGTSVEEVVKSLEGISTGDFYINKAIGKADSMCEALSKALHYFTIKNQIDIDAEENDSFDLCSQCGNYTLKKTGSCKTCTRCNFSTC